MNILLIVHQFFPKDRTGTEVLTLELARGLKGRGHQVQILSGAPEKVISGTNKCWLTQDNYEGFIIHRMHYITNNLRDRIPLHLSAADRIGVVRGLASRLTPDIVQFNHIMGFSAQAIPEIHRMGIPVIFTPTDFWTVCPITTMFRPGDKRPCTNNIDPANCLSCIKSIPRWASRIALMVGKLPSKFRFGRIDSLNSLSKRLTTMVQCVNEADRIFPATRFLANMLINSGVEANRVRVIPYGIDIGDLPPQIQIPTRFSDTIPLRIGFIGTFSEAKGPHVILNALSLLGDKANRVTFDIYGKINKLDPYYQMLQEKMKTLNSEVHFKGTFPPERMGEVLRSFHVIVVPSLWYESAPLVLCSALKAGTLVLISRLEGMTELIDEGGNGFSFPAGDADQLKKMIVNILENPSILMEIQRNTKVSERSASTYTREIESEYLEVIGKNPKG